MPPHFFPSKNSQPTDSDMGTRPLTPTLLELGKIVLSGGRKQTGGQLESTDDQLQAGFFKLPLEVRQLIYAYVFGAFKIHIHQAVQKRSKKPYCSRCDSCSNGHE